MELIYKNDYGASYNVANQSNPNCAIQMVIDITGIFMTKPEIRNLLSIVRNSDKPCNCEYCKGEICGKIWTTSSLVDICIKVDDIILGYLEDLILGTLFILNLNSTLEKHRIK